MIGPKLLAVIIEHRRKATAQLYWMERLLRDEGHDHEADAVKRCLADVRRLQVNTGSDDLKAEVA